MDLVEVTAALLPHPPEVVPGVTTFAAAAQYIAIDDLVRASQLLSMLDDAHLRSHFYAVADEWRSRNSRVEGHYSDGSVPKSERHVARMPTNLEAREVFNRDQWHCRWCATPVLELLAVKRMARLLPNVFGYARTNDACHGLVLACTASLDHVVPHSKGGQNTAGNLVTACWPCQFGRGDDSIDRIGLFDPRENQIRRALPGWDGCEWFR